MLNTATSTAPATASPPSGVGTEVADDGGIDEHVERLDREHAERGERQPQDLAVVDAAMVHPHEVRS
jgi:hypothetical protein